MGGAWCSYMTERSAQHFLSHLRIQSRADRQCVAQVAGTAVDRESAAQEVRSRSKLTGKVTMKGKGTGSSCTTRTRSGLPRNAPVITRLTRTMGFVEMSHSSGVPGSMGASDGAAPENPDVVTAPH
jgi:hypothetical protein